VSRLIALDDGHGMETAGKRTPTFADGTKSTETGKPFMHENEFNRAVVRKLDAHLKRCGFRTLLVAPTDIDTPLKTRTDTANNAKADLYISVHANALTGAWGSAKGIETFYYVGRTESKRAGEIIHRSLMRGTSFVDRGVKTGDLHVVRETKMPSVLVECGFMDNDREARLLMSDAYRSECAEEIARGICEYFGVIYVEESKEDVSMPKVEQWKLDIHELAKKNGIITSDWTDKLDESAPVWMVLRVANALKEAK